MRNLKSLGTTLGLSLAALATSGWLATASAQATDTAAPPADTTAAPADASAAPAKPMHHKHSMHHASSAKHGGDASDAAVEDLNARSLDAAKGGKPFTPGGAAPTSGPAKHPLHPIHRHLVRHHMSPPKPADDAAAPAPAPDAAPK